MLNSEPSKQARTSMTIFSKNIMMIINHQKFVVHNLIITLRHMIDSDNVLWSSYDHHKLIY